MYVYVVSYNTHSAMVIARGACRYCYGVQGYIRMKPGRSGACPPGKELSF